MSEIQEHVASLSQDIGPRPAGTEEEQQAALYLFDEINQETNLPAAVEEFNCSPNYEIPRILYCAIAVIAAVFAIFFPIIALPAFILTAIVAVLYDLEVFDHSLFKRFLMTGISQNVIAKYQPANGASARPRKVVLVAHYDSGRTLKLVRRPFLGVLPILDWAELCAVDLIPIALLVLFLTDASGVLLLILNIVFIVCAVLAFLPILFFVIRNLSAYNEAANCNAAGVSVMFEVASRIANGQMYGSASSSNVAIHGEDAARAEGLIPEGADLVYETSADQGNDSPEARLKAAKAALAAFSGVTTQKTAPKEFDSMNSGNFVGYAGYKQDYEQVEGFEAGFEEDAGASEEYSSFGNTSAYTPADTFTDTRVFTGASAGAGTFAEDSYTMGSPMGSSAQRVYDDEESFESQDARTEEAPEQGVEGSRTFYNARWQAANEGAQAVSSAEITAEISQDTPAGAETGAEQQNDSTQSLESPFDNMSISEEVRATVGSTPSWFTAAQEKAKKPTEDEAPVQRSRYADSLNAAVRESSKYFSQANKAVSSETELRLQQMRDNIMEVKAPSFEDLDFSAEGSAELFPEEAFSSSASDVAQPGEAQANTAQAGESSMAGADGGSGMSAGASVGASAGAGDASVQDADLLSAADRTIAFIPIPIDESELINKPTEQETRTIRAAQTDQVATGDASTASVEEVKRAAQDATQPSQGRATQPDSNATRQTNQDAATQASSLQGFVVPQVFSSEEGEAAASSRKGRSLDLPGFTGSLGSSIDAALSSEDGKQRAPLADDAMLTHDRSEQLRELTFSEDASLAGQSNARTRQSENLRSILPSLSGSMSAQDMQTAQQDVVDTVDAALQNNETHASSNVSQAGSFAGSTGAFVPVGDELLEGVDPQDIYVEDADDSDYTEQYTETGAFAGPGYVDMPSSRMSQIFGRFRGGRNKKQKEESTQQWLGVDDDFEAREVGKARGSWESFREEVSQDAPQQAGEGVEQQRSTRKRADRQNDDWSAYSDQDWDGGAYSEDPASDQTYDDDVQQIEGFRRNDVNTEVWFVALGAEMANNGGMKALLENHANELRGAIFIELEGLGAGELTLIDREGLFRSVKTSSRIKRAVRKATSALGMHVAGGKIKWKNSSCAYAIRAGYQATHLAGMQNGKPAYYGSVDDVIENTSEDTLRMNANFVTELLRNA